MNATATRESTIEMIITRRKAMKLQRRLNRQLAAATAAALALLATACGGDDDAADTTAPAATSPATTGAPPTTAASAAVEPVRILTSDYAFGGLPATVAPGTAFEIENTSAAELHEFVVFRLPDTETRPVDELVHEDLEATLSAAPPTMVLLAAPSSDEQIVAVGDGTVTEPGRYLAICMIPTGADPQAYLDAAATSGGAPPSVPGGPPHAMEGMYGEFTVA